MPHRGSAIDATAACTGEPAREGIAIKCISGNGAGERGQSADFLCMLADRRTKLRCSPPRTSQSNYILTSDEVISLEFRPGMFELEEDVCCCLDWSWNASTPDTLRKGGPCSSSHWRQGFETLTCATTTAEGSTGFGKKAWTHLGGLEALTGRMKPEAHNLRKTDLVPLAKLSAL